ncbi:MULTISPECIES: hypothetical protein [Paenibacillus]|uniref:hypothetical protein n=1 Tax=Paenibacillus TaxID=44249 RepID=UPI00020D6998|nr:MULTISPECIES: hypothetical protein [Paenibacillus]EGL19557.1 hypothetical protein HMPREF9413_4519 [Paenibacillus sp. HGF7]EPD82703.1 hypothetical protein HMPREF1207_03495 [Paenibacillus sp. HGH0039]MBV6713643.1 hypothetical protein [Paenibacillus chitinolyticus]
MNQTAAKFVIATAILVSPAASEALNANATVQALTAQGTAADSLQAKPAGCAFLPGSTLAGAQTSPSAAGIVARHGEEYTAPAFTSSGFTGFALKC